MTSAAIVVASSGWVEFLLGRPSGQNFVPAIGDTPNLIVPAIAIFEVSRLLLKMQGTDAAKTAIAYMTNGRVEPLDAQLAAEAALVSIEFKLPMADSLMYATALRFSATLWTQDADFENLPGVRYFPKARP